MHDSLAYCAIPEMPLQARIPVRYQELSKDEYCIGGYIPRESLVAAYRYEMPEWYGERQRKMQRIRDQFLPPGWFARFFWTAYHLRDVRKLDVGRKGRDDHVSHKNQDDSRKDQDDDAVEQPQGHLALYAPDGLDKISISDGELHVNAVCRIS